MVNGSCCLKIFSKSNYRGMFEVLPPGGHCGYNISKIRSFRFDQCENQYSSTTTPSTTTLSSTLSTTLDGPLLYSCTKDAVFFNESKIKRFVNVENLKNLKRIIIICLYRIMSNRRMYRKNVSRISVLGTCCLKIFEKARFRGQPQMLQPGFRGSHELSSIKSFRFEEC